jgi:hypothetical protein
MFMGLAPSLITYEKINSLHWVKHLYKMNAEPTNHMERSHSTEAINCSATQE